MENVPRGMPTSSDELQAFLAAGPSIERNPFHPTDEELKPVEPPPVPEAPKAPLASDGPDDETRKLMILPTPQEVDRLKKQFPGMDLKVIPMPYSGPNGKMKCYVVRSLNFSQWRSLEITASKISESKPDVAKQEILAEKVVSSAIVWPTMSEQDLVLQKAGLIPTMYGVIQQLSGFFNPDVIAQMSFSL